MNALAYIGFGVRKQAEGLSRLIAVVVTVLCVSVRRSTWSRAVRGVLVRQIFFAGCQAVPFISTIALMVGVLVVVQAHVWLMRVGQSQWLGAILVMVIIREVGPLLANFVIICRSGTAIATELGNMKVAREVHALDVMGLDPFIYLLLPRVLGMTVAVFSLTIVFITTSFASGYVFGALTGTRVGTPMTFINSVLAAIQPSDVFNLLAKTLIPGLLTSAICCIEGLSIGTAVTEVPQAATRAVVRSVTALFIISAIVSILTYI